jgi:hypothetical protein
VRVIDFGLQPVGFVAIGQLPTGVIAIGQGATGVVAVGQLARGARQMSPLGFGVRLGVALVIAIVTWFVAIAPLLDDLTRDGGVFRDAPRELR